MRLTNRSRSLPLVAGQSQSAHASHYMRRLCLPLSSNVGRQNRTVMNIRIATTDSEIAACYPVMRELRSHIAEDQFLSRVRSQEKTGYQLAFVEQSEGVVAAAGFRVGENLV